MGLGNTTRGLLVLADTIKARYLGLGLLWSWIYCSWFTPAIFSHAQEGLNLTWIMSLGAASVGLLVLAFLPDKRVALRKQLLWTPSLVLSATTFALMFVQTGPLAWACAILGGLASSLVWIQWAEVYCALEIEVVEGCVPVCEVVVVFAMACAMGLPAPLSGVFVAAIPLGLAALLVVCMQSVSIPERYDKASRTLETMAFQVKLGVCAAVCSAASSFVIAASAPHAAQYLGGGLSYGVLGGALIGVFVAVCTVLFSRRIDFISLFQWVVPLLAVSLCLFVFGGDASYVAAALLAFGVAFGTDCLFMIVFARIVKKGLCSPAESFGVFRSLIQVGCIVGFLLGMCPMGESATIAVGLFFVCATVCMFPVAMGLQARMTELLEPRASAVRDEAERTTDAFACVVSAYKLSPRESDVLKLLAKGRSVPYIQDSLYISKSTVETHIKHIYAKLDVHSKQEAIDLVEEATVRFCNGGGEEDFAAFSD